MAVFVVAPIILIAVYAFASRSGEFTLSNFAVMGSYLSVFSRSFVLALVSTIVCLILGYPVAVIFAHETTRIQKIMVMLIMLPMWMNFLLRTYAWMSILEKVGLMNTPTAVVIGMVYNFLPFMILPIYSVVVKIDHSLIEAAQDLGGSSFSVFRRVTFPLSLPGVLSGITMVFVPAVSTFVISQLLGGGKNMLLGDLIEMQFLGTAYNPQLGSAIALVMMIVVMIFMYCMNRFGAGEGKAGLL
jgi:spermidine/putrescine transport system permease protein